MASWDYDRFAEAWVTLANIGQVDDMGGAEYRRFRAAWDAAEPHPEAEPLSWIVAMLAYDARMLALSHLRRLGT